MAEYLYEGMFLLDSNRFATDPDGTTKVVLGLLDRVGAQVVTSRPWQDSKLCYPIKGHRKGLYYLACFKLDGGQIGELTRLCKLNETILRQMVIRHEQVIFDAMVAAMEQDGTIHSPEQREGGGGDGRDSREGRDGRDGRDRRERGGDDVEYDKFS